MRRRLHKLLFPLIAVLYLLSIPWYRAAESTVQKVWGIPDWVWVATACYVGVAVLNALAWWLTEIDEDSPEENP